MDFKFHQQGDDKMSLTTKWISNFNEQFAPLSEEKAQIWNNEISMAFHSATDADVIRAIRAMTEDDKCPKSFPKVPNMLFQMRRLMHEERDRNKVPDADCGLCRGIGTLIGLNEPQRGELAGTYAIPCLCTKGRRMAWNRAKSTHPDGANSEVDRLVVVAHKVKDQIMSGANSLN